MAMVPSPAYADTVNGWPRQTRNFYRPTYTDPVTGEKREKSENWTTCSLARIGNDPGTVFADPSNHDRHLVVVSARVIDDGYKSTVIVETRTAVDDQAWTLEAPANSSVLTRCDAYFGDQDPD